MNALEMLTADHRRVERLLDELEGTTTRAVKTRTEAFGRLERDLVVHETIEEEIFYPALREHPKARELVIEAYVEHDVVDRLLGELASLSVEAEDWGPKAKVMIENLRHHIEEEENELFKQARAVFDRAELDELGDRMAARRAEVEAPSATSRTA
jgi:hemerythrin-like domain-containing protein